VGEKEEQEEEQGDDDEYSMIIDNEEFTSFEGGICEG